MISPYDLGNNTVEGTYRITIDELIRKANSQLKIQLVKSELSVFNSKLNLTSSKTRFGGDRLWFVCPLCSGRKGVLFTLYGKTGCRNCLGLKYRQQRYKNMSESRLFIEYNVEK